jgi:type IV secretion system protein VirB4
MKKQPPPKRVKGKRGNPRFARREKKAADMLPYARHIDESTLATRDGSQIQILHIAGFAFETADTQELNYRKNVRDTVLRGIASSRLSIGAYVVRHMVRPGLDGDFSNPFARNLDASWRTRLSGRRLFVNDLFLTLTRKPALPRSGFMGSKKQWNAVSRARDRRELDAAADSLMAALQPYGPRLLGAYETAGGTFSEPLEFLAFLFDGELRPVPYEKGSVDFVDRRVSFGKDTLELSGNARTPRTLASLHSIA